MESHLQLFTWCTHSFVVTHAERERDWRDSRSDRSSPDLQHKDATEQIGECNVDVFFLCELNFIHDSTKLLLTVAAVCKQNKRKRNCSLKSNDAEFWGRKTQENQQCRSRVTAWQRRIFFVKIFHSTMRTQLALSWRKASHGTKNTSESIFMLCWRKIVEIPTLFFCHTKCHC